MSRVVRGLSAIAIGIGTISTVASASAQTASETVFVMTNSAIKNQVIAFARNPDGSFYERNRYDTGGRGIGGTTDPLQSQGALTLSQDHSLLFAANAGSGTLSEFRVNHSDLSLVDKVPTGGGEPLAVTQSGNSVYVLNSAGTASVVGFNLGLGGLLLPMQGGPNYLSANNTGGSSLSVSPNGKFLAVTERIPNNIDTFAINSNGTLGPIVINSSAAPGVFAAFFAPNGTLIVSAVGVSLTAIDSTISSYAVLSNGTISAISVALPTDGAANCWDVVTPNGKFAFASNSVTSTIAGFAISNSGVLTQIADTPIIASNPPGSINLNIAVSGDGKYFFTQNTGTGTVSVFSINNDGTLTSQGEIDGLPPNAGFVGLAAL